MSKNENNDRNRLKERLSKLNPKDRQLLKQRLAGSSETKVQAREIPRGGTGDTIPRDDIERQLAAIFRELLDCAVLGMEESFFELGGHSLLAVRLAARCRKESGVHVPARVIFEHPSVRTLARWIHEQQEVNPGLKDSADLQEDHPEDMVNQSEAIPLSHAQRGLWFIDRMGQGSREYNITRAYRLRGSLDVPTFERALAHLVQRHEVFRSAFIAPMGEPNQVIRETVSVPLSMIDLSDFGPSAQSSRLSAELNRTLNVEYDLTEAPLARFFLIQLNELEHVFVFSCHHIIGDGWSLSVFNTELGALYNAFQRGEENPLESISTSYADFCRHQQRFLKSRAFADSAAFWKDRLKDVTKLNLPIDFPRQKTSDSSGERIHFRLSPELAERLTAFNRTNGTTPYMVMMAAFQVLLHHYTGDTDVVVGSPFANRLTQEDEKVFGFFVNTLAHRTDLSGNPTFQEIVADVCSTSMDMFEHQDMPFNKLVEILNPVREAGCHPVYQVALALQNTPRTLPDLSGIEALSLDLPYCTTHFDFIIHLHAEEDHWRGSLTYRTSLFKKSTMKAISANYAKLLDQLVSQPDRRIGELVIDQPVSREPEEEFSNVSDDYPSTKTISQLFEETVHKFPEAIALEERDVRLTYAELNKEAEQLAARLGSSGVGPGERVGLLMGRSAAFIISILAILKRGACYVPMAEDYPASRIQYIVEDARLKLVLYNGTQPEKLDGSTVETLNVAADKGSPEIPANEATSSGTPLDPAYIIYTSGTTGTPKGVVIPHRGVIRLVKGQTFAEFSPSRRFLFLASPAFDASVLEIWGPLLNGGCCVVYPECHLDLDDLEETIRGHAVTTLWLTAGLFNLVVDSHPEILQLVEHVLAGGEALSPSHVHEALRLAPSLRLTNGYGPTECTTFACTHEISGKSLSGESIPIGLPINHTEVCILDTSGKPVPPGVEGELHVGGDGLAIEYLNDPQLTAQRFIADPTGGDSRGRLYRTGDLCRYRVDGTIDFLGRTDKQVKIRGYRLELGEIEEAARALTGIRQAVANTFRETGGTAGIVLYLVLDTNAVNKDLEKVRKALSEVLPEYAVPAIIKPLEAVPLTPNGKVDYRKLPEPKGKEPSATIENGRAANDLDDKLRHVWERLLARQNISIDDNFFELGGHSLLVARLQAEIENLTGFKMPFTAIFNSPTIRGLCRLLKEDWGTVKELQKRSLVALQPKGDLDPLFCVHGWGGDVFTFIDLANSLAPDRPVYGLQAIGFDGSCTRQETVEEMANLYYREISVQRPEGPYHLIGYSAGGWMAYAVAQNFARARTPVHLYLLDTGMSCRVPYHLYLRTKLVRLIERAPVHIGHWLRLPWKEKGRYFTEKLAWLKSDVQRTGRIPGAPPPGVGVDNQPASSDYFAYVASQYKPKKYSGDLVLFIPSKSSHHRWTFWKSMIRGNIEVHHVESDHFGMLKSDSLIHFGTQFKEVLERREKRENAS